MKVLYLRLLKNSSLGGQKGIAFSYYFLSMHEIQQCENYVLFSAEVMTKI